MTRAAIYTRVSTEDQSENGVSLESQEASCRAYCEKAGYSVATVYHEARSGTLLRERLELVALLDAARRGEFGRVVVHAFDRLSRGDVRMLHYLDVELGQYGCRIESVTEPELDESRTGQLMRSITGYMAGTEREKIVERIGRGRDWRLERGELATGGPELYGYRRDETRHRRAIYEPEAAIVRRLYSLYAAGGSLRALAVQMQADGTPAPKSRGSWHASAIRKMLRNPAYKGETIALRTPPHGHASSLARNLRLPDGVTPAIVTPELWDAVQARLNTNTGAATRNERRPALLRGHIFCGVCGARMVVATSGARRGMYYRCQQSDLGAARCGNIMARADQTDAAAWEWARGRISDLAWLQDRVEAIRAGAGDSGLEERLHAARGRLAAAERDAARLLDLALQDAGFDATLLAERNKQLSLRKSALLDEIMGLEAQIRSRETRARRTETFEDVARLLLAKIAAASWQDKRDVIEALGTHAVWTRGELAFDEPDI